MNLPFDLHKELMKLRRLELKALEADNAVLRQRLKIFPPVEEEVKKALTGMDRIRSEAIEDAVKRNGTFTEAAKELGIGRSTVYGYYRGKKKVNGVARVMVSLLIVMISLIGCVSSGSKFAYSLSSMSTPSFLLPSLTRVSAMSLSSEDTGLIPPPATARVIVAWDPSPDSTVTGYIFHYGGTTRNYTNVTDVGNSLSITVTNMVIGSTYHFAATAYNHIGLESVFSDELIYTIPPSKLWITLLGSDTSDGGWTPISTNSVVPTAPMRFFIQQIKWSNSP